MTTDPTPEPIRIPLAHSVRYVARGLPEVPNQYGPGVLAPSEITLTYRSASDSGLGRVHAYVAGRIWVDGAELPLLPGGLYGQHYDEGLSNWPEWLAEEARLHDPAAVPCVSAVDQTTRDRIAAAIWERQNPGRRWADCEYRWRADAEADADAVLAVLPPLADRAAVLREAAEHLLARCPHLGKPDALRKCTCPAAEELLRLASQEPGAADYASARESVLRRLADEAQQPARSDIGTEFVRQIDSAQDDISRAHAEGEHAFCGDECDDTDLTESDIDRMMAAGTPVQIVTAPPATYAAGVRQQPDTETPSPTDEDFAVAIDSVLDRLLPAIGVSALERTRDQLGGVLRPLVEQLRRERDLAIAHDRQPYPTAWAYEQACKTLRRKEAAIEGVLAVLDEYEGTDWSHTIPAQRIRAAASSAVSGRSAATSTDEETQTAQDGAES